MLRTQTPRIARYLGLYAAPRVATRNAPVARAAPRFFSAKADAEAKEDAAAAADKTAEETAAGADGSAKANAAESESAEPVKSEWQVKFEAKDKEAAKLKEAYQRSIADFRNLQKTTEEDKKKASTYALQKFAKDLIESVDNFDLAIKAYPEDKLESAPKDVKDFHEGITMVHKVLEKTLAKYGIVKVDPKGEKFDPNEHEALFQIPQEGTEPGTIIHVDRTGFKLHDRVLRAPKVGFVKDPAEN